MGVSPLTYIYPLYRKMKYQFPKVWKINFSLFNYSFEMLKNSNVVRILYLQFVNKTGVYDIFNFKYLTIQRNLQMLLISEISSCGSFCFRFPPCFLSLHQVGTNPIYRVVFSSEGALYVILPYDYPAAAPTFWTHTGP